MIRFFLAMCACVCVRWSAFAFHVSHVSVTQELGKKLWVAVFLIEQQIDEHTLSRAKVVELISEYGESKRLTQDPRLVALISMIDFHHKWVVLEIQHEYGDNFFEYGWWLAMDAKLWRSMSRNPFSCAVQDPKTTYASLAPEQLATISSCQLTAVMEAQDIVFTERDWLPEDLGFLSYLDNAWEALACYLTPSSWVTVPQVYLWDGNKISYERIDIYQLHEEVRSYVAQLVPFTERQYGSHGPAGFACQSVFHRFQEKNR